MPGRGYEEYQGDAGQLIKAGSHIDFYMHYTPTGAPQKDRTKLGLYFAKPGQAVGHQIYHSFGAAGPTTYIVEGKEYAPRWRADQTRDEGGVNLPNIPPYAENWKVVSVHTIREPITLYGLTPHLHLRGKSMKLHADLARRPRRSAARRAEATTSTGRLYYELETPKKIPARQQGDRRHAVRQLAEEPATTRRRTRKCSGRNRVGTKCTRRRRRNHVDGRDLKKAQR